MYKVKLVIIDKSFKIHIFLYGSIDPLSFTYPVQSHSGTATYPRCHRVRDGSHHGPRFYTFGYTMFICEHNTI